MWRRCQSTFLLFKWIMCRHKIHVSFKFFFVSPLVSWITLWSWSALPFEASSYALTGKTGRFSASVYHYEVTVDCIIYITCEKEGQVVIQSYYWLNDWIHSCFVLCSCYLLLWRKQNVSSCLYNRKNVNNFVCCHFNLSLFLFPSKHTLYNAL